HENTAIPAPVEDRNVAGFWEIINKPPEIMVTQFRRVGGVYRDHIIPPGVHVPGNPCNITSLSCGVPALIQDYQRDLTLEKKCLCPEHLFLEIIERWPAFLFLAGAIVVRVCGISFDRMSFGKEGIAGF